MAILLAACGGTDAPAPEAPSEPVSLDAPIPTEALAVDAEPVPAERVAFVYQPLDAAAETYGTLRIMLPLATEGPGRTFAFANGALIEATLLSGADITLPVGQTPMNEVLGVTQAALENGGAPRVYTLSVQSEQPGGSVPACGERALGALLLRQPESETDATVTISFLTALPTDPLVEVCQRAVFIPG